MDVITRKLRLNASAPLAFLTAIALAALIFLPSGASADTLLITGGGSTFAYPMYAKWFEEYRKVAPEVRFTYQPTGSGAGIHDVMLGLVDFGGTDGPLNKVQMLDFSTHRNCEVLHFPMALGADVPIYNLPGISHELNFTPEALARIFLGQITRWDDPAIAVANPGVAFSAHEISVVHRSDASGTTYVWTDYLSKVSRDWKERVGTSIAVLWPAGVPAKGNAGVAREISQTPYAIGYAELTYAVQNKIAYGKVKNAAGEFVKADFASVTAAAAGAAQNLPDDFRVSITNAPGAAAYPIASFTWMLIPSVVADSAKRDALIGFLQWSLTKGQDYLEPLSYARLPGTLIAREETAISKIASPR
jgi:phosphate transport system substrate-binding protein